MTIKGVRDECISASGQDKKCVCVCVCGGGAGERCFEHLNETILAFKISPSVMISSQLYFYGLQLTVPCA